MLLPFDVLATLPRGFSNPSPITASVNEVGNSTTAHPSIEVASLQLDTESSSLSRRWTCQCSDVQTYFCPYCEYDRTSQILDSKALKSPAISSGVGSSGSSKGRFSDYESTPPTRKLRKLRSDYKVSQSEIMSANSTRPDSILSNQPVAPLFVIEQPINRTYSVQRTPRKLEKKIKGQQATSSPKVPAYSSPKGSADAEMQVRIVKSKSFLNRRRDLLHSPRPRPVSASLETSELVSLAWTGETVSSLKSSDFILPDPGNSLSPQSTFSLSSLPGNTLADKEDQRQVETNPNSFTLYKSSFKRPLALRKAKEIDSNESPNIRPWTLAMVITDDSITDEKFVDDLENMRIKENPDSVIPGPYPLPLGLPPGYYDSLTEYPLELGEVTAENPTLSSNSSWNTARRALLLCRELVRTERHYLASLRTLITNGTSTPPPPSMLSYLPGLIAASETLLSMMEENPSVHGVSHAFVTCEAKLVESFVNWCGVVGRFFDLEKRTKSNLEDTLVSSSPRRRQSFSGASSCATSADTGLPIVIPEPNKIRRNVKARPAVRELAILPTQRVTRYVLLLKELRSLTPSTLPSSDLVKNAVRAAEFVAAAANEAQGHSILKAFHSA